MKSELAHLLFKHSVVKLLRFFCLLAFFFLMTMFQFILCPYSWKVWSMWLTLPLYCKCNISFEPSAVWTYTTLCVYFHYFHQPQLLSLHCLDFFSLILLANLYSFYFIILFDIWASNHYANVGTTNGSFPRLLLLTLHRFHTQLYSFLWIYCHICACDSECSYPAKMSFQPFNSQFKHTTYDRY